MRKAFGAVLFAFVGAAILLGAVTLFNVWDEFADSPDSTYIEGAAIWLDIALIAGVGGAYALRGR